MYLLGFMLVFYLRDNFYLEDNNIKVELRNCTIYASLEFLTITKQLQVH